MFNIRLALSILFICLFSSCKKENQKTCWNLAENGYIIQGQICDKTQKEMEEQFGNQYLFVRTSEPRYCWRFKQANATAFFYRRDVTQSMIDVFYQPFGYYDAIRNAGKFHSGFSTLIDKAGITQWRNTAWKSFGWQKWIYQIPKRFY